MEFQRVSDCKIALTKQFVAVVIATVSRVFRQQVIACEVFAVRAQSRSSISPTVNDATDLIMTSSWLHLVAPELY